MQNKIDPAQIEQLFKAVSDIKHTKVFEASMEIGNNMRKFVEVINQIIPPQKDIDSLTYEETKMIIMAAQKLAQEYNGAKVKLV